MTRVSGFRSLTAFTATAVAVLGFSLVSHAQDLRNASRNIPASIDSFRTADVAGAARAAAKSASRETARDAAQAGAAVAAKSAAKAAAKSEARQAARAAAKQAAQLVSREAAQTAIRVAQKDAVSAAPVSGSGAGFSSSGSSFSMSFGSQDFVFTLLPVEGAGEITTGGSVVLQASQ